MYPRLSRSGRGGVLAEEMLGETGNAVVAARTSASNVDPGIGPGKVCVVGPASPVGLILSVALLSQPVPAKLLVAPGSIRILPRPTGAVPWK